MQNKLPFILVSKSYISKQNAKLHLDHIESRRCQATENQYDVMIQCLGSRDRVKCLMNSLMQCSPVRTVTLMNETSIEEQKGEKLNIYIYRGKGWTPLNLVKMDIHCQTCQNKTLSIP